MAVRLKERTAVEAPAPVTRPRRISTLVVGLGVLGAIAAGALIGWLAYTLVSGGGLEKVREAQELRAAGMVEAYEQAWVGAANLQQAQELRAAGMVEAYHRAWVLAQKQLATIRAAEEVRGGQMVEAYHRAWLRSEATQARIQEARELQAAQMVEAYERAWVRAQQGS